MTPATCFKREPVTRHTPIIKLRYNLAATLLQVSCASNKLYVVCLCQTGALIVYILNYAPNACLRHHSAGLMFSESLYKEHLLEALYKKKKKKKKAPEYVIKYIT